MRKIKNEKITMLVFIIAMAIIAPNICAAAPVIATMNGTVADGNIITITGSGFGTKSPVAPILYDPNADYNGWYSAGDTGSNNPATVSTSYPRGHVTRHYTNATTLSGKGDGIVGGINFPTVSSTFYVSWWLYAGSSGVLADTANSNKWTRFTTNGQWSSANGDFQWQPMMNTIYDISNGHIVVNWEGVLPSRTTWTRFESVIDNTGTYHPYGRMYLNNTLVASLVPTNFSTGNITGIYTLGANFEENAGAGLNARVDFGEIYVDNTLARVEICNGSTKSGSDHCEIQIPTTQWIDGQLQITINQGSFAAGSTAYLYVIDASGNVSAGKKITFGTVVRPNPPALF